MACSTASSGPSRRKGANNAATYSTCPSAATPTSRPNSTSPPTPNLVRLERLRRIDGAPLAHDTAWLPLDVGAGLLEADFRRTALYDELAKLGQPTPDAGGEWIYPVLPGPAERRLLDLPAGEAVYRIVRRGTATGRPIEWRETLMRADRYTLVARWSPSRRYEPVLSTRDD